jgi:DNA modification methylase
MRELDAASIDSVVTDPPYGLSFMGKEWDHGVPGVEFWLEAFRVLKPGAHLVAFGGTRTFHRLAVAIEDAGFQIRDCLSWIYGSGFPKSLDISKAIDRGHRKDETGKEYVWSPLNAPTGDVYAVTGFLKAARDKAGKTNREIDALFGFNGMAGHWTSCASQPEVPNWPVWARLKEFLGFGDELDELVERLNGGKGDRSIENTALAAREVVGAHEVAAAAQTWKANYGLEADTSTGKPIYGGGATAAARAWAGWGTALKPAWEPVILARKPVAGTIVSNVLAHGTGALNVDACRIGTDGGTGSTGEPNRKNQVYGDGMGGLPAVPLGAGRWPANVCLDEEAARRLDRMSEMAPAKDSRTGIKGGNGGALGAFAGSTADGVGMWPADPGGGVSRFFFVSRDGEPPASTPRNGSGDAAQLDLFAMPEEPAATAPPPVVPEPEPPAPPGDPLDGETRFFYSGKASAWDRNEGLDGLPEREAQKWNSGGIDAHRAETARPMRNVHATVKPTDLMRWLCKLVTPPGGVVLDPFCGSGSTGVAAEAEGFRFIGIEKEPEYAEIAERRIANVSPLFGSVEEGNR